MGGEGDELTAAFVIEVRKSVLVLSVERSEFGGITRMR